MTKPEVAIRKLDIDFAPDHVKIYSRPESPRAGQNVTLVCETAPSRPASTISWWHNGEKLGICSWNQLYILWAMIGT